MSLALAFFGGVLGRVAYAGIVILVFRAREAYKDRQWRKAAKARRRFEAGQDRFYGAPGGAAPLSYTKCKPPQPFKQREGRNT